MPLSRPSQDGEIRSSVDLNQKGNNNFVRPRQAPINRGRSAQDITHDIQIEALMVGEYATVKIDECISGWKHAVTAKKVNHTFHFRNLFRSKTNKEKEFELFKQQANQEIKSLKQLKSNMTTLRSSLAKKKEQDIVNIHELSNKILLDAKKLDEKEGELENIMLSNKIQRNEVLIPKDLFISEDLWLNLGGKLEVSREQTEGLMEELRNAEDVRIKNIQEKMQFHVDAALEEINGIPQGIMQKSLTRPEADAIESKFLKLCALQKKMNGLISEMNEEIPVDDPRAKQGPLDAFKIFDGVERELDKILSDYKLKIQLLKKIDKFLQHLHVDIKKFIKGKNISEFSKNVIEDEITKCDLNYGLTVDARKEDLHLGLKFHQDMTSLEKQLLQLKQGFEVKKGSHADLEQVCQEIEAKLAKISTRYTNTMAKIKLEDRINRSSSCDVPLPPAIKSHWQSKLKAIKPNAESKQLIALNKLNSEFEVFLYGYQTLSTLIQQDLNQKLLDLSKFFTFAPQSSSVEIAFDNNIKRLQIVHEKLCARVIKIQKDLLSIKNISDFEKIQKEVRKLITEVNALKHDKEKLESTIRLVKNDLHKTS